MARPKTKRAARYWYLRFRHFSPVEAREFSKLSRKYPALKALIRQRVGMWLSHGNKARARGWSDWRVGREWVDTLKKFYGEERYKLKKDRKTGLSELVLRTWVVRKDVHGRPTVPKPSPWEWYDSVFRGLPDELKWDTPRSHRTGAGQGEVKVDKIQARRWIEDLKKSIQMTDDPERKEQLKEQIANLSAGLRRT